MGKLFERLVAAFETIAVAQVILARCAEENSALQRRMVAINEQMAGNSAMLEKALAGRVH